MPQSSHQDVLEIELIRSLFESRGPARIMSVGFVLSGSLLAWQTRDPIVLVLLVLGTVLSAVRLGIVALSVAEARSPELTIDRARALQRRFAVSYIAFATVLGMFGFHMLSLPFPYGHILTICILVGYAAGVAATTVLQPRIAIPAMLVSVTPALIAALSQPDPAYWATSLMTCGFLWGGTQTVAQRQARAAASIGRRLAFSKLARQDGLTGLPNRLALRERFDERVASGAEPGMVAVHFLDLNGFKPVNDRYGHHVGDALLIAVSQRIARTIRATDTAARLGGDEFAIVQCGVTGPIEAALLAQRLAAAIGRPYRIDKHRIRISTGVGYVLAEHGAEDLECLLTLADEALYASKRAGCSVTRWTPDLHDPARDAA